VGWLATLRRSPGRTPHTFFIREQATGGSMPKKKSKRKSISKKLRFEIFKRDGFSCGYCGNTPPKVILEVDHIEPVSKGGESDINNYITACFDCNRGKGSERLNKIPETLSVNLETLKEKESQIREYQKFITAINRRITRQLRKIEKIFQETYPDRKLTKKFRKTSLKYFIDNLPKSTVENAMYIATSKIDYDFHGAIKYFCGVCWCSIRES